MSLLTEAEEALIRGISSRVKLSSPITADLVKELKEGGGKFFKVHGDDFRELEQRFTPESFNFSPEETELLKKPLIIQNISGNVEGHLFNEMAYVPGFTRSSVAPELPAKLWGSLARAKVRGAGTEQFDRGTSAYFESANPGYADKVWQKQKAMLDQERVKDAQYQQVTQQINQGQFASTPAASQPIITPSSAPTSAPSIPVANQPIVPPTPATPATAPPVTPTPVPVAPSPAQQVISNQPIAPSSTPTPAPVAANNPVPQVAPAIAAQAAAPRKAWDPIGDIRSGNIGAGEAIGGAGVGGFIGAMATGTGMGIPTMVGAPIGLATHGLLGMLDAPIQRGIAHFGEDSFTGGILGGMAHATSAEGRRAAAMGAGAFGALAFAGHRDRRRGFNRNRGNRFGG